jgi:hypothetical protein
VIPPGVLVVVSVALSFISAIDPIAGIWKLSEAAPTSTKLPDESAKVIVSSLSPLFNSPVGLASVIVRLPAVVDLIILLPPDDPPWLPHAAISVAIAIRDIVKRILALIDILLLPGCSILSLKGWKNALPIPRPDG